MYIVKADFTTYAPSCTAIPDAEFNELGERASEVIDVLTQNRIVLAGGLSTYSTTTQAQVKKAVCAQLQMMYVNGGIDTVTGQSGADAKSVQIGKFSISKSPQRTINGIPLSPLAEGYLVPTGLLYRGMSVKDGGSIYDPNS